MLFCTQALEAPPPTKPEVAIIFGQWKPNEMGPVDAVAFLRHAFGTLYSAFVQVETNDRKWAKVLVFATAVENFVTAALRMTKRMAITYANTVHTPEYRPPHPQTHLRFKFMTTEDDGGYTFSSKFAAAVAHVRSDRDTYLASLQARAQDARTEAGQAHPA